ncbi:hypothetical protein HK097_009712 [Rhizophlyctis rosea]|uniref:F-box domain-containing protein n=1 Tax=Rhizophlyctis rosea TaxID=64517 RepID=A0AAD5SGG8_9FUNG|nr:hypothetical protein HK097_009712 [Rhizophlyctis rosea]
MSQPSNALPPDIWSMIIYYLPPQTLRNLRHVSHSSRSAALTALATAYKFNHLPTELWLITLQYLPFPSVQNFTQLSATARCAALATLDSNTFDLLNNAQAAFRHLVANPTDLKAVRRFVETWNESLRGDFAEREEVSEDLMEAISDDLFKAPPRSIPHLLQAFQKVDTMSRKSGKSNKTTTTTISIRRWLSAYLLDELRDWLSYIQIIPRTSAQYREPRHLQRTISSVICILAELSKSMPITAALEEHFSVMNSLLITHPHLLNVLLKAICEILLHLGKDWDMKDARKCNVYYRRIEKFGARCEDGDVREIVGRVLAARRGRWIGV